MEPSGMSYEECQHLDELENEFFPSVLEPYQDLENKYYPPPYQDLVDLVNLWWAHKTWLDQVQVTVTVIDDETESG